MKAPNAMIRTNGMDDVAKRGVFCSLRTSSGGHMKARGQAATTPCIVGSMYTKILKSSAFFNFVIKIRMDY